MARSVGTTTTYKTWQALNLINTQNLFVVAGRTTDWDLEPAPDAFVPTDTAPDEPIVAIRPYLSTLATEVTESQYNELGSGIRSSFVVGGITKYFKHVANVDAYDEDATYVIAIAEYNLGHPAPDGDWFRAYYLCAELVPAAGHESDNWLAPADVDDYGMLFYINNGAAIEIGSREFTVDLICLIELR